MTRSPAGNASPLTWVMMSAPLSLDVVVAEVGVRAARVFVRTDQDVEADQSSHDDSYPDEDDDPHRLGDRSVVATESVHSPVVVRASNIGDSAGRDRGKPLSIRGTEWVMIDETVEQIEEMQTHSSSVVAVRAARALQSLTDREFPAVEEYLRSLERNSHALRRANPSHASLHTTQRQIVERVRDADPDSLEDAQRETRVAIEEIVEQVGRRRSSAPPSAVPTRSPTTTSSSPTTTPRRC